MTNSNELGDILETMQHKDMASLIPHLSSLTRRFYSGLPVMVRNDVKRQIMQRCKRIKPTRKKLIRTAEDAVKAALKYGRVLSFSDGRGTVKAEPLSHDILMRDDA